MRDDPAHSEFDAQPDPDDRKRKDVPKDSPTNKQGGEGGGEPMDVGEELTTEQRFRRIREELEAMKLPDLSEAAIAEELREAQRPRLEAPEIPKILHSNYRKPNPVMHDGKDPHNVRGFGLGISAAYALVGSVGLGCIAGWMIGRSQGAAVGALVGAVFGVSYVVFLASRER